MLWLWGVRRTGKTSLAQSQSGNEYLDCELPAVRRLLADPAALLASLPGKTLVLDEVHRLHNAAEVLKLAAESFPDIRLLAIGPARLEAMNTTLGTSFRSGIQLWLTPMVQADLVDLGNRDLNHRFLHGGLPPHFLSPAPPDKEFQAWMDSYWAKDVQELFRLERRDPFQRFVELVLARSGELFEATQFTAPCGVSRGTIVKYLSALEATGVALVVRPFSSRRSHEIITAPKVYGFDTGFVCVQLGWTHLRSEDLGRLWPHYVLNEIAARTQGVGVRYWRDKQGHEVSFVCAPEGGTLLGLECAWSANDLDPAGLLAFARNYPQARLLVATTDAELSFKRSYNGVGVEFVGLSEAVSQLAEALG
jgi:predicted AAA+ superfamily ATPase